MILVGFLDGGITLDVGVGVPSTNLPSSVQRDSWSWSQNLTIGLSRPGIGFSVDKDKSWPWYGLKSMVESNQIISNE